MEDYKVKLPIFEGPLDLLWHLIQKNKIDIYDIPMAEVTRQYLDYLAKFREFDMDLASSFLVMAATLLQIKSRMMLPRPPKENDEEEEPEDPRAELVERLLEYKKFREAAELLADMASIEEKSFARDPMPIPSKHTAPDSLPLVLLIKAFRNALKLGDELKIPQVIVQPESYNINDKMARILDMLARREGKAFFEDLAETGSKGELVVLFLALLELIKLKAVTVRQDEVFATIYIFLIEYKPINELQLK